MNNAIRVITSLPGAVIAALLIFLVLAAVISHQGNVVLSEESSVQINITRQLQDTSQQTTEAFQRPVLDQPPPPLPTINDRSFRPGRTVQLGALPGLSDAKMDITPGFNPDRDAQPLVRIPPQYPQRCIERADGSEAVLVEFDVTFEGTVISPRAIEATNSCFNSAAMRAVERWLFHPKIVDNVAEPRLGVRTTIEFQLRD